VIAFVGLTPSKLDGKNRQSFEEDSLALHPSVIKRHRQSEKRRARNVESKTKLRTLIKKARQAIESKDPDGVSAQIKAVNRALDKAVSKGTITRNTASRWLSRLSRSAAHSTARTS
jgi:small subunit ribosomal protein S20